jgi:hypothetical protein
MGTEVRPLKIISGGQTGVDRAAWDVAIELGLDWGGWVPKGRKAEDGRIPDRYDLCMEAPVVDYKDRTSRNVRDAHATLLVTMGKTLSWRGPGTELTARIVRQTRRPTRWHDLERRTYGSVGAEAVREWLDTLGPADPLVLNVAGSRESSNPGIYAAARSFLLEVLR